MLTSRNIKQSKPRLWVGRLQMQLINTQSLYVGMAQSLMMLGMFWYTTAAPNVRPVAPWFNFWFFLGLIVVGIMAVMVFDFVFVYPSRQSYLNQQAYKHENPVVEDIKRIDERVNKIFKHLGLEDD